MNRKSALFFWLYFFEGAPIGLIWWTIPTLLSLEGVTVDQVTAMTASAALPWTLKFLAGPWADRFLSTQKDHAFAVAFFQMAMLLSLLGLWTIPLLSPWLPVWIFLLSLFSALQDVVVDAWAIGSVPEASRGSVNGAMQAGTLSGRWVFGAGLLLALQIIEWRAAVVILMLFLAVSFVFLVVRFRKEGIEITQPVNRLNLNALKFVKEKRFLLLAFIALTTGFAFESVGSVASPFLIHLGFDRSQVGIFLSSTVVLMLVGSLLGGKLADRLGSASVFLGAGFMLSGTVITLGIFNGIHAPTFVYASLVLIYFLIGVFTSSSYAFYMEQSKGEMEATRFTFLMAITNLCEVTAAFTIGRLASGAPGYSWAFAMTALISIFGLLLLRRLTQISQPLAPTTLSA